MVTLKSQEFHISAGLKKKKKYLLACSIMWNKDAKSVMREQGFKYELPETLDGWLEKLAAVR